MAYNARISFLSFGIVAAFTTLALTACDNGTGGGGGSTGASTGTPASSSGTPATGTASGTSSGSTTGAITCPGGDCAFGNGGYAFSYADSQNPAPQPDGTSMATLATDDTLCISGNVMALPSMPTQADYSNDWGCGIGINLDQSADGGTPAPYTLTGTGVTVGINATPSCPSLDNIRVVLTDGAAMTQYCAPITPGVEIPWADFNTTCWMPSTGTPLAGPPSSVALKVQFVTTATACTFTNFCLTQNLALTYAHAPRRASLQSEARLAWLGSSARPQLACELRT